MKNQSEKKNSKGEKTKMKENDGIKTKQKYKEKW
jgi:hypothetical protein